VTDDGDHPSDYYQSVLQPMTDPRRPWGRLDWRRMIDYDHACQDVQQLADVIFGPGTASQGGPSGCGSSGKPRRRGWRGSSRRRRRCGASAASRAKPTYRRRPMRISTSAVGGCGISPTGGSTGPSAVGSPRRPAKLSARSGSSARGGRGRFPADQSSWTSASLGAVASGMRCLTGTWRRNPSQQSRWI
jgi:hypothetical protein